MGIKRWWDGKPRENETSHAFVFIGGVTRHWTSRWAHAVIEFVQAEWKWVIGTVIAIIGLLIALKKL